MLWFVVVMYWAHFTDGFSIAIQIRREFRFTLASILTQRLLQNFDHDTS